MGLTKHPLGCMLYRLNLRGGSMKTTIAVLFVSAFLAGCGGIPRDYKQSQTVTTTVTVEGPSGTTTEKRTTTTTVTGTGIPGYESTYIGIGVGSMSRCRPYWGCVP